MRNRFAVILAGAFALGTPALAVSAGDDPVKACLAAAAQDDPAKTVEFCTRASKEDPENQDVKQALEVAKAAIEGGGAQRLPAKAAGH